MPKNQFLDDTRRAIESRISELQLDIDKLKKYQAVIDELEALDLPIAAPDYTFENGTVPKIVVHNNVVIPPPSPKTKRKYSRKPKEAAMSLSTTVKEGPRQCQRCKVQREYTDFAMGALRRKRVCIPCEKREAEAPPKPMGRPRIAEPTGIAPKKPAKAQSGDETTVYSKPMRCPKCQLTTRFERRPDASPDDFWTCLENNCQLRIGNYNIALERKGAAA